MIGDLVEYISGLGSSSRRRPTPSSTLSSVGDASHVRDYLLEEWEAMLAEVGLSTRFLDFWEMRMEFDDRTGRMHTPPVSVAASASSTVPTTSTSPSCC